MIDHPFLYELRSAAIGLNDASRSIIYGLGDPKESIRCARRFLADVTRHKDKLLNLGLPPTKHKRKEERAEWEYDFRTALSEHHLVCVQMLDSATKNVLPKREGPAYTKRQVVEDQRAIERANKIVEDDSSSWIEAFERLSRFAEAIDLGGTSEPGSGRQSDEPRVEQPPPRVVESRVLAVPEWSLPKAPKVWTTVFDVSFSTFKRWIKADKIRYKKLSPKLYMIAIDDLPKKERDKHRTPPK